MIAMKMMLIFLFLILAPLSSAFTQSEPFFSSVNDEYKNLVMANNIGTSSPLMMFHGTVAPEEKKSDSSDGHRTDRSNNHVDPSSLAARDTTPGAQEDNTWEFVYVSPNSQTVQLQTIILCNNVTLKSERTKDHLLQARDQAIELRKEAEDELKEIESSFQANNEVIKQNFHDAFLERIKDSTPFSEGYDIVLPPGFENDTTLKEAEKSEELIALSETKAAKLQSLSKKALSALPLRNVILENGGQGNKVQQSIQQAETSGASIIKKLQDQLANATDCQKKQELAEGIIRTSNLVQKMQQLMLGYHTPFYITAAKNNLNCLFKQASTDTELQQRQLLLENIRTCFLFAEAESPEAALAFINDIIQNLCSEIERLKRDIEEASRYLNLVRYSDQYAFGQALQLKSKDSDFMEMAILTYQQIQNELTIETECGSLPDLRNSIEKDLHELSLTDQGDLQQLRGILTDLENATTVNYEKPKKPLHFLRDVNSLGNDNDHMIITGEHGKIILEKNPNPSEETFLTKFTNDQTDKNRKKWINGVNLIRFAIARKYGMKAVEIFDARFKIKRDFDISLSIKDLKDFKDFLADYRDISASHFLHPLTSIEKFMVKLKDADEGDVLKWSKAVFEFNPFLREQVITRQEDLQKIRSQEQPQKSLEEIHRQEAAEGIEIARQFIEKKFQTFAISKNRFKAILERFNTQIEELPYLTVRDFRIFIAEEEEKIRLSPTDLWSDFFPEDIKKSIIAGAASTTASLTIALFAHHLLPLNAVYFLLGGGVGFTANHIINFFRARSATAAPAEASAERR